VYVELSALGYSALLRWVLRAFLELEYLGYNWDRCFCRFLPICGLNTRVALKPLLYRGRVLKLHSRTLR